MIKVTEINRYLHPEKGRTIAVPNDEAHQAIQAGDTVDTGYGNPAIVRETMVGRLKTSILLFVGPEPE